MTSVTASIELLTVDDQFDNSQNHSHHLYYQLYAVDWTITVHTYARLYNSVGGEEISCSIVEILEMRRDDRGAVT